MSVTISSKHKFEKLSGIAPQNFLLWSEELQRGSDTPWSDNGNATISATNTANDMNGQSTLDTLILGWSNGDFYQTLTNLASGHTYRFSFECKRGTATDMQYAVWYWHSGNADSIISATSYYAQTNVSTPVRVSVEFAVPAGMSSVEVHIVIAGSESGDFYVGRCQVEENGSAYVKTEGTAIP